MKHILTELEFMHYKEEVEIVSEDKHFCIIVNADFISLQSL